jgi:hypothetical protein
MSSHVGTIVILGFPPKKRAAIKELGDQHSSSATDPNFPFEQGRPRCMLNLLTRRVHYFLCLQMLVVLCLVVDNDRIRVVGSTRT